MTTLFETLVLIGMFAALFGWLAVTYFWICALAKWVWLLTIRRWFVIAVTFAVLIAVAILVQLATGIDMLASLGRLIGLVVTPIIAVPIADYVAYRRAPRLAGRVVRGATLSSTTGAVPKARDIGHRRSTPLGPADDQVSSIFRMAASTVSRRSLAHCVPSSSRISRLARRAMRSR